MKLMIVDDDIQIREGIQYGIDWDTIGITGVKSYGDGIEALGIITTPFRLPLSWLTSACLLWIAWNS